MFRIKNKDGVRHDLDVPVSSGLLHVTLGPGETSSTLPDSLAAYFQQNAVEWALVIPIQEDPEPEVIHSIGTIEIEPGTAKSNRPKQYKKRSK